MQTDIPILPKESLSDMYKEIRDYESLLSFYTGLSNSCLFNYILEIVKQRKPYKCKTVYLTFMWHMAHKEILKPRTLHIILKGHGLVQGLVIV